MTTLAQKKTHNFQDLHSHSQ